MEEKYNQNANKLTLLQNTLINAAQKIQRMFRRYKLKKSTLAAIKIQRFVRKVMKRFKERRNVLDRCRVLFSSYKIYYFLKSKCVNSSQKHSNIKESTKSQINKIDILTRIRSKGYNFTVLLSSLHSELYYIKKYMAYDRKKFT